MEIKDVKTYGNEIKSILNLNSSPVGVKFNKKESNLFENAENLEKHRYCQALMKARGGKSVVLSGEEFTCPAAANAFGFSPLPEKLKTGEGLVGFGIVSDPAVGKKMFENMTRLEEGSIDNLYMFPLETANVIPDVVIVEDDPEKLMWIALAYLHVVGGERIESSTAILQATCVDSTIIPFLKQRLNFVYGCYGCRDATDLGENEAMLGFPGSLLPQITEQLKYLNTKAIPRSRAKGALSTLRGKKSATKTCQSVEV